MTLKLKAEPTFSAAVPVPVPGGEPVKVSFTFKHRTKTDFEQFMKQAREKNEADVPFILDVAVGWELSDPFNAENIALLLQNYHGAAAAISRAYATELSGARLGN